MKNCTDCDYANWNRTANGRLHPSGDGECEYLYIVPVLPNALYWSGMIPKPCGGRINRKKNYGEHCPYFARKS